MKKILCPLLALLPLPLFAAVPADLASLRDVSGAPIDAPRLVEVRLDAAVMAATRPGFPDLRLFDAENREIPRAVEPLFTTKERIARYSVAASTAGIRELSENRIEARFDLDPAAPSPTALEIRTPLRDFIRTVRVSGSEDGQFWQPLADAEIFDYSRYLDFRRTLVALPTNYCRHFAVEISNATEERAQPLARLVQADGQDQSRALEIIQTPFRIAGVSFWQETATVANDEPVLQEWPHAGMTLLEDRRSRITDVVLDVRRAPLSRIDLETPERNFNRLVTIQVPALFRGRKSWRSVADGIVTRIDLPGLSTNAVSVRFPEQRVEQLRVVVQNADSPPIEIAGVRTYGPAYRLLWLAQPAAAYRLACGSDQLAPPDYDLYPIRAALEQGLAPEPWRLAPPPEIPVPATPFRLGDVLARPAVFGACLVLAAAALLVLLAKALRKAAP
ncbi:MAG: DUF3999 family protein [Kiritimatiellia bacterium]